MNAKDSAEKLVQDAILKIQNNIYDFLCFLCEKLDDDYKSKSIAIIEEWKDCHTSLYGYKVLDNLKEDLAEKLKNDGIPFLECDINNQNMSCFIVPADKVQHLETYTMELAVERDKVSETSLDAVNDYCFGKENRQRNELEITGKDVADRLLQNLSKHGFKETCVLFNRETIDEEKQIYKFYYPAEFTEKVNQELFKSVWEVSGDMAEEIINYDKKNLERQADIRQHINDFYNQDNTEPLYLYDASSSTNACVCITKETIVYSKDGTTIAEQHVNMDNEETLETLERWMDSFDVPFATREEDTEKVQELKAKEMKKEKAYYQTKENYKEDIEKEQAMEKLLRRCFKNQLNPLAVEAILEYVQEKDKQHYEKVKEIFSSAKSTYHIVDSTDLSRLQRTRTIDKEMEKAVDKEIEKVHVER